MTDCCLTWTRPRITNDCKISNESHEKFRAGKFGRALAAHVSEKPGHGGCHRGDRAGNVRGGGAGKSQCGKGGWTQRRAGDVEGQRPETEADAGTAGNAAG